MKRTIKAKKRLKYRFRICSDYYLHSNGVWPFIGGNHSLTGIVYGGNIRAHF
ncbi:MAG: hypothetical protein IJ338_09070 [Bacteroidaceae bacterium]|nr:hypothetical protein [Bacteroidaceae bacterium]